MNLVIANTAIRQDADGRYYLNDLHKAAGGEPRHRPGRFLRLDQTKELIDEINQGGDMRTGQCPEMGSALATINGGHRRGSYACIELVYAYAMWISAAFHLKVIRAYHALVTGNHAPTPAALPAPATTADIERLLDMPVVITGREYLALKNGGGAPAAVHAFNSIYTPPQREAIFALARRGLSVPQIAEELGFNPDGVRTLITRARQRGELPPGPKGGGSLREIKKAAA